MAFFISRSIWKQAQAKNSIWKSKSRTPRRIPPRYHSMHFIFATLCFYFSPGYDWHVVLSSTKFKKKSGTSVTPTGEILGPVEKKKILQCQLQHLYTPVPVGQTHISSKAIYFLLTKNASIIDQFRCVHRCRARWQRFRPEFPPHQKRQRWRWPTSATVGVGPSMRQDEVGEGCCSTDCYGNLPKLCQNKGSPFGGYSVAIREFAWKNLFWGWYAFIEGFTQCCQ